MLVIMNLLVILVYYKTLVILMKIKIIYLNYNLVKLHLKVGNGMKIINKYIYINIYIYINLKNLNKLIKN